MATQAPLSAGLKAKGLLEGEAGEEYSKYLADLKASLDARKNRSFDPSMLAMAAGFLSPTQTGGFGESLGNAMRGYTQAQAAEEKQDIENASMRLQIAQAENEQRLRREALQGLSSGQVLNAPQAGGQPAQPSGPMFRGMPVTPELVARMKIINPELGAALESQLKLTYEGVATQPGGSFKKATGEYTPFGGKTLTERFVPGDETTGQPAMNLKMTEEDAIKFDLAQRTGDAKTYYGIIDQYTRRLSRPEAPRAGAQPAVPVAQPSAPAAQPVEPAPTAVTQRPSGSFATTPGAYEREQEVEKARQKTEAEIEAKARVERTNFYKDQGRAALDILPVITQAETLLKTPGIDKVLAVLERGDVKGALGSLASEAFRAGNYTVGIPAIRKVLTEFGTPQNLIDTAAQLAQSRAVMNFQLRQGLGSGTSVSNFEQMMVNAMGPSETDTPATYAKKLSFMREQANFRRELSKELATRKMQFDDFEQTKDFDRMFNDYKRRVESIIQPKTTTGGSTAERLKLKLQGAQ